MRRTYKSRKEMGGGLDRRDVLLTMDDKSSAFDAFYIQNIKQTKRELSCIGSSNHQGVASNKVRKKKYVKRIVKNVEPSARDSLGASAYLTPDKSLHVNKGPDLFDQLLNSSPAWKVEGKQSNKENLFDKLASGREIKSYRNNKKKLSNYKKFNYSASSESDKENNKNDNNDSSNNVSDIRAHQLLIEKVSKPSTKFDDSINNIVKNFSLLNNLRRTDFTSDGSIKKNFRHNKNRLTKNIQSPLLQNTPLSSTPFSDRNRCKSIYNFSPIPMKELDSPNITIAEETTEPNQSIIFITKPNSYTTRTSPKNISCSPVTHFSTEGSYKQKGNSKPLFSTEESAECILHSPIIDKVKTPVDLTDKDINILSKSTTQISELEPFFGFSNNSVAKVSEFVEVLTEDEDKDGSVILPVSKNTKGSKGSFNLTKSDHIEYNKSINPHMSKDDFDLTSVTKYSVPMNSLENFTECDNEKDLSYSRERDSQDSSSETNDDESYDSNDEKDTLYDTCNSEQSFTEDVKEPIVVMQRLNDSLFEKYYKKMPDYSQQEKSHGSDKSSDYYASFESEFHDDANNMSLQQDEYEAIRKSESKVSLSTNSNDSSVMSGHGESCSDDESLENITIAKANTSNDNDRCISFVTTRRRNECKRNSSILVLDDSNNSISSAECDKTVLSNNFNSKNFEIDEGTEKDYDDLKVTETRSKRDTRTTLVPANQSNDPGEDQFKGRKSITNRISYYRESSIIKSPDKILNDVKPIVLQPGKKWERSLSIYRRMTSIADRFDHSLLEDEDLHAKGRKYRQSVIETMKRQESKGTLHNESFNSRRSTFVSKPSRSTIRIVKESNNSRVSLSNTTIYEDLKGFLEDCNDTIVELSKLSIADEREVTVLDNFHDTGRVATARDFVLRRCGQTDVVLFDECYPDPVLKNCRKIGEGVYGEVFLWRATDGRARVMKIVPIAGITKVNGEHQKDFHEIISEIVIAMELSALRAPIAEIECHFDEGKDVEALDLHTVVNATDVFNEVLTVKCVYGGYPSRLLDLWELYDECKGSDNDNPAILPPDQQYVVLELANAGQDLESYQFNNAEQAYALFLQVAYGLAVGEESFQFEHRDLHWGNVLIAPTDQKFATFVLRGRLHRVPRRGVAATIIDYSLSRVALAGDAALYNDLAGDDSLFAALGDYQFEVYRLMRDKLGNDWKNFEPYTNILWLHYTVDKMITALRYKRTNTKTHKQFIAKLKGIKDRILNYGSAVQFVLTDNEF